MMNTKNPADQLMTLLLMALSIPCMSFASSQSAIGTIKRFWTYPVAGGGDVLFELDTPTTNCKGFWVRPADDDTSRIYTLLLSARADHSNLRVFGDDADLWPGSSDAYCRLTFVGFWERVQQLDSDRSSNPHEAEAVATDESAKVGYGGRH